MAVIMLGRGSDLMPQDEYDWRKDVIADAASVRQHLALSDDEHHVRDYIVREIAVTGQPVSPHTIAAELDLSHANVLQILENLERGLTFLYRAETEDVVWAYPVTAAETPHRYTMKTPSLQCEEERYAA